MATDDTPNAEAGPSTNRLIPGATPFHESSQFRHWRYSTDQLDNIRSVLNKKSVEVVAKNQELERLAQIELNHNPPNPLLPTAYLSVNDELLLLRFYCTQISRICRLGFGLPEVVEATAVSYLKRFYLKNSVMEWHPKTIMPTCLFLAAKTTNYPVLIDAFIPKFAKLQAADVIDTEFLVAQSLSFEFWVRGAEKGVRGWFLELQTQPNPPISLIQSSLPQALLSLSRSRLTDLEFIYTPSQIALGCWYTSSSTLILDFLNWKYTETENNFLVYGMTKDRLIDILIEIEKYIESVEMVDGEIKIDMIEVKNVDKRLRGCTNPEKTPGTALYLQRKQQKQAEEASARASKSIKAAKEMSDREMVFGNVIQSNSNDINNNKRKPLSPMLTIPSPVLTSQSHSGSGQAVGKKLKFTIGGSNLAGNVKGPESKDVMSQEDGPFKADAGVKLEEGGMGIKDEAMGMLIGGKGLKEVGRSLEEED